MAVLGLKVRVVTKETPESVVGEILERLKDVSPKVEVSLQYVVGDKKE